MVTAVPPENLFCFGAHGLAVVYDVEMRLDFSKKRQRFMAIGSSFEAKRFARMLTRDWLRLYGPGGGRHLLNERAALLD